MAQRNSKTKTNKQGLSRAIPNDIKLQVRKRCGFGCIICGIALYEYEHFSPEYNQATVHDPNGITLLCPNHHANKTKGRLPIEVIQRFDKKPKTLQQGFANENFNLAPGNLTVSIGDNTMSSMNQRQVLVHIEDEPILSIRPGEEEGDCFLISANLRDKKGNIILGVIDNEWKVPATYWDIKNIGKKIEIRSAKMSTELILRQDAPNTICVERLRMRHLGYEIEVYEGKPMKITNPYNQKNSIGGFNFIGTSSGVMTYKNSMGIGLAPNFSPEEGYKMLKEMHDAETNRESNNDNSK